MSSNQDAQALTSPESPYIGVQTSDAHTERDLLILADLNEQKLSYRSIARKHDVGLGVVAWVAQKWKPVRKITDKFMAAEALEALDDWRDARKEAAKKGDHRPAKDWLLHAQEIEPVEDRGHAQAGVTIIIGDGHSPAGAPPAFPSLQVIDSKALPEPPPE